MTTNSKFFNFNIDRASARIGILLTACVPLLAIYLTHFFATSPEKEISNNISSSGADTRLIEFCSRNVKSNRAFVLFQHGTCVVVEDESNPEAIKDQGCPDLEGNRKARRSLHLHSCGRPQSHCQLHRTRLSPSL